MALLRELPVTSGNISLSGRVAYVSQQPWVFSGTLKENILFGKTFDKQRYEQVIHVCALETVRSLKKPFGTQTGRNSRYNWG
jgi:ATP-binding cassette subfamily C (CFTR/MRP) protein 4